ncbi:MAG: orotidine-5'-phosphate decarboxylase [Deltaproteobacteria bacterium]
MDILALKHTIKTKKSFLCVGLDTDPKKIPACLQNYSNPVLEFNRRIIEATRDYAVAYKINTAFYEAEGLAGWKNLSETIKMIPADCMSIADAKRADIGNTSEMYARAFFLNLGADAVTVAPYMGKDSVSPFLKYSGKWTILLALTSNEGSNDFQYLKYSENGTPLFENVLEISSRWGTNENMMFVIGATHPDDILSVRKIVPDHFLLVPGVGAQGGDLKAILERGINKDYGLLINVSRAIIYASDKDDFDIAAKARAVEYTSIMEPYI